jgi:hypothetical protein
MAKSIKSAVKSLSIRGFAHCRKGATTPTAYVELFDVSANGAERPVVFRGSYVQAGYVRWLIDNAQTVLAALNEAEREAESVAPAPASVPVAVAPVAVAPAPAAAPLDMAAMMAMMQAMLAGQMPVAPVAPAPVAPAPVAPVVQSTPAPVAKPSAMADRVKARANR